MLLLFQGKPVLLIHVVFRSCPARIRLRVILFLFFLLQMLSIYQISSLSVISSEANISGILGSSCLKEKSRKSAKASVVRAFISLRAGPFSAQRLNY